MLAASSLGMSNQHRSRHLRHVAGMVTVWLSLLSLVLTAQTPSPERTSVGDVVQSLAVPPDRLAPINVGVDPVPIFLRRPDRPGAHLRIGPTLRLPLLKRGPVPKAVDLKLGQLYLDVTELAVTVLVSDNAGHTEKDPDRELLASTSLGLALYLALTENLRLEVVGSFVWLPRKGETGLDGFGVRDIYSLGVTALFDADLYFDCRVAGWDVIIQDTLRVSDIRLQNDLSGILELYPDADFSEVDIGGDYDFGNERPNQLRLINESALSQDDGTEVVNTASFTMARRVPMQSRLYLSVFHRAIHLPGDSMYAGVVPESQRGLNLAVVSERDAWRLNPYLAFNRTRADFDQGWTDIGRVGVQGELNDRLHLLADVGVGRAVEDGIDSTMLWRVGLRHLLGPLSRHELVSARQISGRDKTLQTVTRYTFDQILGPYMRSRFFWDWRELEQSPGAADGIRERCGGILFFQAGPRLGLSQKVVYSHEERDNGDYQHLWTYATEAALVLNPSSFLVLGYEHRRQLAALEDQNNFRENLVALRWLTLL